jgi:hypothetical protein
MKEEPSNPNAEEKSADQCPPESSADAPKNLIPEQVKPALTPEEQMAAFEKDLKENDWGHQPC